MAGNIKQYLAGIVPDLPAEIIAEETYCQINKVADLFSDFAASEYIMETHLNSEAAEADFSFRILTDEKAALISGLKSHHFSTLATDETWSKIIDFVDSWSGEIGDIWLEMDADEYEKQIPQPCFFFNASQVKNGTDVDNQLLLSALKKLLDDQQLQLLWPNLQEVIHQLPFEVGLFQVGVMLARNSDQVRIFTAELTREQTKDYLSRIGWTGSFSRLNDLFLLVDQYSDGQYILDFDVSSQGVSDKIGINFGLAKQPMLPAFLEKMTENQLCTDAKKRGVLAWSGSQGCFLGPDYGFTALIKDISHFKVSIFPAEDFKVKAYLRYAGIYLKKVFAASNLKSNQTKENETEMRPAGYQEMQNAFKEIVRRSMLDKDYRELCLKDSQAAIQTVIGNGTNIPENIIFLEEEPEIIADDRFVYILPPFLKPSWLTSK